MARHLMQGDPLYILFDEDGESVFDSQNRPRMYKSVEAFERAFPRGMDGVHLEKYIPSQQWISVKEQPEPAEDGVYWCCGYWFGSGRKQCETAEYLGEWKIVNNFILTHWMPLPEAPKEE